MSMRFAIDPWAPEYGSGIDDVADAGPTAEVEPGVEVAPDAWAPRTPAVAAPDAIVFVDGVNRIDAQVWIAEPDGATKPGLCATYAAGAVRCDGAATILGCRVERGLFTSSGAVEPVDCRHGTYEPRLCAGDADQLPIAVIERMRQLEAEVARGLTDAELIILDGLLWGRADVRGAVGYVKSHRAPYLPEDLNTVVAALEPGQRTPLFIITTQWSRLSWYMRLPGGSGHPWAGIVRCEVSPDLRPVDAARMADLTCAALPRYASSRHRDPRAPQNLYPIAGLERELRRRSGDRALVYRELLGAARAAAPA